MQFIFIDNKMIHIILSNSIYLISYYKLICILINYNINLKPININTIKHNKHNKTYNKQLYQ